MYNVLNELFNLKNNITIICRKFKKKIFYFMFFIYYIKIVNSY